MKIPGLNFITSYTKLPPQFFTWTAPTPVSEPKLVLLNQQLARELGLDFAALTEQELAQFFSGNLLADSSRPFAQAYAGHQFGHFTMLGDGRAIMLGEFSAVNGVTYDLQLKGAGPTPYARQGDGRAALAPMLREYLVSEAMHALGIPSTRSLAVVSSGETVHRDGPEPGAILARVARSHIRVGTFEFAALQQDGAALKELFELTIKRLYPELLGHPHSAVEFLRRVTERQAKLVAEWMRVGFIHGVMNTDNMAISGETLDFGPCAFLDAYDPLKVFSSIDYQGRYAFMRQASIAQWNLACLANAMSPLFESLGGDSSHHPASIVQSFSSFFSEAWLSMMRAKLGLSKALTGDSELISNLLNLMYRNRADYTNTFSALTRSRCEKEARVTPAYLEDWAPSWGTRLALEDSTEDSISLMRRSNPQRIPRNHILERALSDAALSGDYALLFEMRAALEDPYRADSRFDKFAATPSEQEEVTQTFCGT